VRADKINHEIEGFRLAAGQLEGQRISSRAGAAGAVTADGDGAGGDDVRLQQTVG